MSARVVLPLAVLALFSGSLEAQSRWQIEGGRMRALVAGRTTLVPGDGVRLEAVGDVSIDFPANAAGKPASLRVAVDGAAHVRVAVDAAAAPQPLPPSAFAGDAAVVAIGAGDDAMRASVWRTDDASPRDYRITARVLADAGTKRFGLVARHREGQGCYLFVIDRDAGEARLERWFGDDRFVVRRTDLGGEPGAAPTLTLAVQGFRLQAFVDDRPLLRTFDGALPDGGPGVVWSGARPRFEDLVLTPPAERVASAALVRRPGAATLHAAVTAPPGSVYVLELALDRPHPWVPRGATGLEPWLCQPFAAPVVLWADWRGSLGPGSVGEVDVDGGIVAELRWPDLAALRHRAALVRAQVATADGDLLVESTPAASVVF